MIAGYGHSFRVKIVPASPELPQHPSHHRPGGQATRFSLPVLAHVPEVVSYNRAGKVDLDRLHGLGFLPLVDKNDDGAPVRIYEGRGNPPGRMKREKLPRAHSILES